MRAAHGACRGRVSPRDAAHTATASEATDGRLGHCKHTLQVRRVDRVGRLRVELTALDVIAEDLQHTKEGGVRA